MTIISINQTLQFCPFPLHAMPCDDHQIPLSITSTLDSSILPCIDLVFSPSDNSLIAIIVNNREPIQTRTPRNPLIKNQPPPISLPIPIILKQEAQLILARPRPEIRLPSTQPIPLRHVLQLPGWIVPSLAEFDIVDRPDFGIDLAARVEFAGRVELRVLDVETTAGCSFWDLEFHGCRRVVVDVVVGVAGVAGLDEEVVGEAAVGAVLDEVDDG